MHLETTTKYLARSLASIQHVTVGQSEQGEQIVPETACFHSMYTAVMQQGIVELDQGVVCMSKGFKKRLLKNKIMKIFLTWTLLGQDFRFHNVRSGSCSPSRQRVTPRKHTLKQMSPCVNSATPTTLLKTNSCIFYSRAGQWGIHTSIISQRRRFPARACRA